MDAAAIAPCVESSWPAVAAFISVLVFFGVLVYADHRENLAKIRRDR